MSQDLPSFDDLFNTNHEAPPVQNTNLHNLDFDDIFSCTYLSEFDDSADENDSALPFDVLEDIEESSDEY